MRVCKKMPYKDPAKRKEYFEKYREKNREKFKEYDKERYETNKVQVKERDKKRYDDKTQYAVDSITAGRIIDQQKWNTWCDAIKRRAKKHPYSIDFTNDIIFDMMIRKCFYCGDIATTIDRIDSTLGHVPENCVGCCYGCNNSKGAADPSTFIRKSYYRARGKYIDDVTDVWFVNKNKPRTCEYKQKSKKKGVSFELNEEKFEFLLTGKCAYCRRSPTTWFGIDRVIPLLGYIDDNVVTCCFDCNVDKHTYDVDMMTSRNNRIAERVDNGEIVIEKMKKMILHQGMNEK